MEDNGLTQCRLRVLSHTYNLHSFSQSFCSFFFNLLCRTMHFSFNSLKHIHYSAVDFKGNLRKKMAIRVTCGLISFLLTRTFTHSNWQHWPKSTFAKKSHYQSKVFVCVSSLSVCRVIARMRSISFQFPLYFRHDP